MSAEAEPLVLSGLDEASLYHNPGEHGFFTLLWCNPETVARLAELKARQRELLLFPGPDSERTQPGETLKLPRLRPKIQKSYRLSDMPRVIEGLNPNRDTWISQAEFFRPNRRVVYLLRLNLCFVDLDTYKTPWKAYTPETLATIVRGYCQDEDIPEPSLILYSGRGLQLKWLFHRPLPPAALPRWNATQRELVTALERFGADPGARDASRLLRLVGYFCPSPRKGQYYVFIIC
jgi:hypothetical protein